MCSRGGNKTEEYTHDAVGNILSSLNLGTQSYNTSNQLTSTSIGSYAYDNNGNTLTDANSRSYTWDYENRLTQADVSASGPVTFKYDPFGRRIQKSSANGTTIFVYDGSSIIAEYNENGSLMATYAQGPGIDEPLAQFRSGIAGYYHADGLGSVTSITDGTGAVINTYTYDVFGNQTASTGSLANPFRYTAREFDGETGLYYHRARYYDPQARRFISEDPIGLNGGINLYGYVGNDPINLIDPYGLQEKGYWRRSGEQILLGNFTDEVTLAGTAGQIGTGLIGIDLPADIRDISADFINWKWSWGHAGQTALDAIGFLPVIGVLKYGDEVGTLCKATKGANAIRRHHSWAKYLGGAVKQDLVPLSKSLHDAYHGGLDKILPRQKGTAYYDALTGEAQIQMYRDLANYTKAFDAKYGTQLYKAMLKNGFPIL